MLKTQKGLILLSSCFHSERQYLKFKAELDSRYEDYKNGAKFYTEDEVETRLNNIIIGATNEAL